MSRHDPDIMFPHTVDSTIMGTMRSCSQKGFLQYVRHWKPIAQSVHLVAGGAFASGIEAARLAFYVEGANAEDAEAAGMSALVRHYGDFECPSDSAKSLERMLGALEFYFCNYPLGADGANPITLASGRRGIEFSFAEPLSVNHPVTGMPILYTGRSDMIAERAGGIYIYDEKTTSSLGASWGRQWEMRSQFTGYAWAAHKQGIKTAGAIIRGVSILKTKYDTVEVPTYRSQYEIERWEEQLNRDVERMIQQWKEGYWDYNLDGGCNEYGGCSFTRVCKSSDPQSWLPMQFQQRVWDPLLHKELTVKEYEDSWEHVRSVPLPDEKEEISSEQSDSESQALSAELDSMFQGAKCQL
jgi:hypothetical protein